MAFLTANSFFQCVFKNTDQKDICASIVFKAESKPKHEEIIFWGVFHQKRFLGGPKWQFLEIKFRICISGFVLQASCQFSQKNINIQTPWNFSKMKTLAPEIWFWTSKIMPDLWLSDVFCQIQKKKITPPYFMCTWYEYEYNHSACKATTHGAFAHHPLASAHHPLSFFSLYLRSSFLFWPLIFVLCPPLDSAYHPLSSFIL